MSPAVDPAPPTIPSEPPRPRHRSARRAALARWTLIGVVSVVIHLAALDVLPHWTLATGDERSPGEPLRATLMPPIRPPEEPPVALPAPPAPRPNPKEPSPKPRTIPRRPPPAVAATKIGEPAAAVEEAPAATTAEPVPPAAAPPAPSPQDPAPATPPAPASPPPPPAPAAVAPQSARLSYKVLYIDAKNPEPVRYYGVGSIDWSSADGRYRSDLLAAVDFLLFKVNVLASHSEGSVTPTGLAPDRYTESPRKRATVATNFNRDARQSISFSASEAVVPLVAGTQDRLSVLFQIGALLLAGSNPSADGVRISIPVAGVRGDVEEWVFVIEGIETLETRVGALSTTHLQRAPRPGSSDRTIDVWIAHADGAYPARVLYTEPNGSTIEMTLDRIGRIE